MAEHTVYITRLHQEKTLFVLLSHQTMSQYKLQTKLPSGKPRPRFTLNAQPMSKHRPLQTMSIEFHCRKTEHK